ncbi:chymotrypsin-like protease CTRL-1 [Siphateles boraxobius]|uniref:chymotrypsin-like protease CTRL-1 n=1 Tax=Siphateles boraxobius TaxID=180520 RepID=UPI004064A773
MELSVILISFIAMMSMEGSNAWQTYDCGVALLNTRIVGGTNAPAGNWPWQVSMHYNGRHICGGTLIHNQWVMTAAHCTESTKINSWSLYLGRETQSTSGVNTNEVRVNVQSIIVHPNYNSNNIHNDISLMKLSQPVTFTPYIRPICLASKGSVFPNGTTCWATGWGNIGKNQALPFPQTLQEVEIPVVGNSQCSCQYKNVGGITITPQMICAGRTSKGTCQGDSGGPIQCKQGSVWVQAGITSFGTSLGCAIKDFPEVFSRVSEFNTWVTDNVEGATIDFVAFTSNGTDGSFTCSATLHFSLYSSFIILFTALISNFLTHALVTYN